MKYICKVLLVLLFLSSINIFAEDFNKPPYDNRLDTSEYGQAWYKMADSDSAAAFNIGLTYDIKIKDYKLAELWYKQAWSIDKNGDALINLGLLYDQHLGEYKKAELWYKKRLKLEPNNPNGLFNLSEIVNEN